jgi:hypothetical protein
MRSGRLRHLLLRLQLSPLRLEAGYLTSESQLGTLVLEELPVLLEHSPSFRLIW